MDFEKYEPKEDKKKVKFIGVNDIRRNLKMDELKDLCEKYKVIAITQDRKYAFEIKAVDNA